MHYAYYGCGGGGWPPGEKKLKKGAGKKRRIGKGRGEEKVAKKTGSKWKKIAPPAAAMYAAGEKIVHIGWGGVKKWSKFTMCTPKC